MLERNKSNKNNNQNIKKKYTEIASSQGDLESEQNTKPQNNPDNNMKKIYQILSGVSNKKINENKKLIMLNEKDDFTFASARSNEAFFISKNMQDKNQLKKKNTEIISTQNFMENNINNDNIEFEIQDKSGEDSSKGDQINYNNSLLYDFSKPESDLNDIFNLILSHDFFKKITYNDIYDFFFNSLPKTQTLNTNINIINNNIENNFNYNLEILRNNKIYFVAKIKKYLPYMNISIIIQVKSNEIACNNNFGKESQRQLNEFEMNNQIKYIKVGKIMSNFLRNKFFVFRGNHINNYKKILEISYDYNFLGTAVRKMNVSKFFENKIILNLINDLPVWDYEYKTYKYDFNGRVKKANKRNFCLIFQNSENNEEEENKKNKQKILQCGQIDDNSFALDFINPLAPFEAFCISITSLIYKFSCV